MFRALFLSIPWILLFAAAGCTTLSKDECLQADWRGLGYQDGSRGYPPSRINLHREACSEYKVQPRVQAYQTGHAEGIGEYCRPQLGYRLGLRAGHYGDVCPVAVEEAFVAAYEFGKSIYYLKRDLHQVEQQLARAQQELQNVEAEIALKEDQLVSPRGAPVQRRELLREIKNLDFEKQELQSQLHDLQNHSEQLAGNIERLKYQSPYH